MAPCSARLGVPSIERVNMTSDAVVFASARVLADLGVAELPAYLVAKDVAAGQWIEVLPGTLPVRRRVDAFYLASPNLPGRIRELVLHLLKLGKHE